MKEIEFNDNIVKRNKIPILMYTPEWIQLFSGCKSNEMIKTIKDLEQLFTKEKDLEKELSELDTRKKTLMKKILYISRDMNDEEHTDAHEKMDEAEKELEEINKRIPVALEEMEELPFEINEKNTELLKETIMQAYEMIEEHKGESEKCQNQVNEIRKALGELIKKKVDLQENVNKLYSYIHGMVGAADMEKLDQEFLSKKSDKKK